MDPTCVFNFFTFFERILYKSNCMIFIFSWCGTHTKIRNKLVVIVTSGSQKITLWGPQRTPLGILRVKRWRKFCTNVLFCITKKDKRGKGGKYGRFWTPCSEMSTLALLRITPQICERLMELRLYNLISMDASSYGRRSDAQWTHFCGV